MVDISLDRKVGGVVSYFHCVIFLLLDRLALIHYTRFQSTIPWYGRPWVEHGVTTECLTIRVIVRALYMPPTSPVPLAPPAGQFQYGIGQSGSYMNFPNQSATAAMNDSSAQLTRLLSKAVFQVQWGPHGL